MKDQRPVPQLIPPHSLPWQEHAPGILRKPLWAVPWWSDPSVPRSLSMMRYDAGAKSPQLRQVGGDELVYVIEGVLSDEYGDVTAGNVAYRPEGCVHSQFSRSGATTLSLVTGATVLEPEKRSESLPTRIINVNEMPWVLWQPGEGDHKFNKVTHQKDFWADPEKKRRAAIYRWTAGFENDPHEHLGDELVYHVEGSFVDEAGLGRPGDIGYRPYGCHHSWISENGGIAIAFIWGGWNYFSDQK